MLNIFISLVIYFNKVRLSKFDEKSRSSSYSYKI